MVPFVSPLVQAPPVLKMESKAHLSKSKKPTFTEDEAGRAAHILTFTL